MTNIIEQIKKHKEQGKEQEKPKKEWKDPEYWRLPKDSPIKNKEIWIRVSQRDYDLIKRMARESRLTVSAFIRNKILGGQPNEV